MEGVDAEAEEIAKPDDDDQVVEIDPAKVYEKMTPEQLKKLKIVVQTPTQPQDISELTHEGDPNKTGDFQPIGLKKAS